MTTDTAERPATLLLVEDNEITREGMTAVLRNAGYDVVVAPNGRQALDFLESGQRPALLLLDMLMPEMDGWEVLRELRAKSLNVPVVVVTGTILTREWANSQGCPGFLHKPVETETLLAEVKRLVSH